MKTKKNIVKTLLMQLMRIINKRSDIEECPVRFGGDVVFTPREIHSIQAIGEHEQINVKELGDYFGVTKSAASQMVTKLTGRGVVKKVNPADNNKELQLSLTEAGWEAFRAHEHFHARHMKKMTERLTSAFTEEEIEKVSGALHIIEQIIDENISELDLDK